MANYMFNIGKGREVELFNRVDQNEPANSVIVLVPLKVIDTEVNCQDFATLEAVLAGTPDEQTEGASRKVLTDSDIAAIAVNNASNYFPATVPAVKWSAFGSGKNTLGLLICYDSDSTGGTDANILPLIHVDFAVNGDANEVELQPGDVSRAS